MENVGATITKQVESFYMTEPRREKQYSTNNNLSISKNELASVRTARFEEKSEESVIENVTDIYRQNNLLEGKQWS